MTHNESRVKVRIWDDRDWLKLPIDGQWLYQLFLSQQLISKAGVLPIPRRMWSNLAADEDAADRIAAALKILIDRRFVVIDDDTDELLVRTYIRNISQHGPPGTFRAAMDAAIAARSAPLRAVLHAELLRLDVDMIAAKGYRGGEAPIAAYRRALAALAPDAPPGGGGLPEGEIHAMDMPCSCHAENAAGTCHTHGMRPRHVDVDVVSSRSSTSPVLNNSSSVRPARTRAHAPAPASARDPAAPPGQDPPSGRNGLQVVMDSGSVDLPARAQADFDEETPGTPATRRAGSAAFQAMGVFDEEAANWPITPQGRERGRWVHAVAQLISNGIPVAAIVAGMRACSGKGCGPRALDSFVFGEANRASLQSRADRNVAAIAARQRPGDGPGLRELAAADAADRAALGSGRPMTVIEGR